MTGGSSEASALSDCWGYGGWPSRRLISVMDFEPSGSCGHLTTKHLSSISFEPEKFDDLLVGEIRS